LDINWKLADICYLRNLLIVNMEAYKQSKNRSQPSHSPQQKSICIKRMNFSQTVIGLHVCYNQEILVNSWSTMQLITNKYVSIKDCLSLLGGRVWCNLVYPPGMRRIHFSLTVIGLHVYYNQEILVNILADHRQICVIYDTVYFCMGGSETLVWPIPRYTYFSVAHPQRAIFSDEPR
jgi:hypothetical protein